MDQMNLNYGHPQVHKQELIPNDQLVIEQGLSNDILFQVLSTAELYALGKDGNRKFKG